MKFLASLDKRRWTTAVVTLILAFLSGFLMQTVLTEPASIVAVPGSEDVPKPLPTSPQAAPLPILHQPPRYPDRVQEQWSTRVADCEPRLTVSAAPAATLRVDLTASCSPNQTATLRQGPITVGVKTDAYGRWQARIPAFEQDAEVEVAIGERLLRHSMNVPEADQFRHVMLQWNGPQVFRINAYEFGAKDQQNGHVWSGAPKAPERALRGGGFLTRLGDETGSGAEIYSVPVGAMPSSGVIRLTVDAEITETSCDQTVEATAYQSGPLGRLSPSEVLLKMPGCERIGEHLRLQNLFPDMRLALH
ncbi:MAG: hypothetical protein QNJ20_17115 [Paracoccaceae bacterium]|nr:hypothetical protein [Paracoccaceae bacterium]